MGDVVESFLLDVFISFGKKYIQNLTVKYGIRQMLRKYLYSQEKFHQLSNLQNEFDFEELKQYLLNKLAYETQIMIFCASYSDEKVFAELRKKAICYAKAKYPEAQERVVSIIANSIMLLRDFRYSCLSDNEKLLYDEIRKNRNKAEENSKQLLNRMKRIEDELTNHTHQENIRSNLDNDEIHKKTVDDHWNGDMVADLDRDNVEGDETDRTMMLRLQRKWNGERHCLVELGNTVEYLNAVRLYDRNSSRIECCFDMVRLSIV